MFGELLFSFDSLKLGISYKAKKPECKKTLHSGRPVKQLFPPREEPRLP